MSQTQQVLAHLKRYGEIDPLMALDQYGCFRLAARIYDIRRMGHDIIATTVKTAGNKEFARYSYRGEKKFLQPE
jgi:hypothetical protein